MTLIWLLFILAGDKPLTHQDIMKTRRITNTVISDNGAWVAYVSSPDRGDGEGVVITAKGENETRVPFGTRPQITPDGAYVGFITVPSALDQLKAEDDKKLKEKLKNGMALVKTSGDMAGTFERVKDFAFSDDSRWMARHHFKEEKEDKKDQEKQEKPAEEQEKPKEEKQAEEPEKPEGEKSAEAKKEEKPKEDKTLGTWLVLTHLADGAETKIEHVTSYAFDPQSRFLTYAVSAPEGKGNGLYRRNLRDGSTTAIDAQDNVLYAAPVWDEEGQTMALIKRPKPEKEPKKNAPIAVDSQILTWRADRNRIKPVPAAPAGWGVPFASELTWTDDGRRLFLELKPVPDAKPEPEEDEEAELTEADLYDLDALVDKRNLDIWHGLDPRIKPHEREEYADERKRAYLAVYHLRKDRLVPLADENIIDGVPVHNDRVALLHTDKPYRRAITWDGPHRDFYIADLETGVKTPVVKTIPGFNASMATLSPEGGYVVWYQNDHLHLFDTKTKRKRNLTKDLPISFANEDHDYPSQAPGYGFAGWMENDEALLAYDKFDLWVLPTNGDTPYRMTEGRAEERQYRVVELDEDQRYFTRGETLLLDAYSHRTKADAIATARAGEVGVRTLIDEPQRFSFRGKAKDADRILYHVENFQTFPNLRSAKLDFSDAVQITDENPQLKEFAWGSADLISWQSADGEKLDGALLLPAGYKEGDRVPVLVYFYRFFSPRLHFFPFMRISQGPNFAYYTSNGYAVFLPDIRFEVERPGDTSVKSLVPGVQKLIDMGIAHPDQIALHGHSWSGYQTAYIITQTDMFAAAVAGAPVSNMTSAYSGIRLGSGLARQFQYEAGQSRIGATLWERRDLYIDNSPVFFADRITTPLMIMFGDKDTAVPWQQGIELYLAMRRLDKDVVFLQYRGEPHGLRQFPNKLDYSIKMKQYFDHYLLGEPAPDWLAEGEPYAGD